MPVVNYQQQVLNPVQSAMEGYSRGVGIVNKHRESQATQGLLSAQQQEAELRTQKLQQEQEAAAATQKQLGDLGQKVADGTWTAEDFLSLQTSNPAIAEHLSKAFEGVSDVKKKTVVSNMQKLAIALETNPEEAKQIMEEEAQAIENSGGDPSAMRANIKAIDIMPDAVKTSVLATLAAGMPNDEFDNFTQTLNPPKEKPQTDFGKLAADVEAGLVTAEDANAIRESRIKELQQKYNLTDAQMQQALAATEKTKAETSKLLREADAPVEGVRYLSRAEKEAAGYNEDDVVQQDADGKDQVRARAGEEYTKGEIKAYRNQAGGYLALRGALNSLRDEVKEQGDIVFAMPWRKDVAKLDSLRRNVQMQLKGLLNLGVLSKDDYEKLDDMIPAATGAGAVLGSDEALLVKYNEMNNELNRRLASIPDFIRDEQESMMNEALGVDEKQQEQADDNDGLPAGFVKVQ